MKIRNAIIKDIPRIHALISEFAKKDLMLFRSLASLYENIQNFFVAEIDGEVIGCCSLAVVWSDLAEVKSLAVQSDHNGKGIGRKLVLRCIERGHELGVAKIFTLTLEPVFFEKVGFARIKRMDLPMKVWSDCARCPKQDNCDEIAMIWNQS